MIQTETAKSVGALILPFNCRQKLILDQVLPCAIYFWGKKLPLKPLVLLLSHPQTNSTCVCVRAISTGTVLGDRGLSPTVVLIEIAPPMLFMGEGSKYTRVND